MRALLLLLLAAGPAAAQADLPAAGSELFRGVLHRQGYVPTLGDNPRPRVVVLFGQPGRFARAAAVCRRTLDAGGSVLVVSGQCDGLADCFPTAPAIDLLSVPLPKSDTLRLQVPDEQVGRVRGNPTGRTKLGLTVPEDVVTGLPYRWLQSLPSPDPWVGTWGATQSSGWPFAVGGTGPPDRSGRVLVLASDDVFSNRLIAGRLRDDVPTGNLEFALAVARWLKPPGDEPTPCLFVESGRPVGKFDEVDYRAEAGLPLPDPAPPPLDAFLTPEAQAKLADAFNETVDRVQTNDRLNNALAGRNRFPRTMRWAAGLLALLAAVALLRRARAARIPAAPKPVAEPDRPAGPLAQRRAELLVGGDHTAAVKEYLVDLFAANGLPLDQFRHPRRMPRVVADRETRQRVRTLWGAAFGPDPVTYTRWKELEPMVEAVRAAGAAGRWRFAEGRS